MPVKRQRDTRASVRKECTSWKELGKRFLIYFTCGSVEEGFFQKIFEKIFSGCEGMLGSLTILDGQKTDTMRCKTRTTPFLCVCQVVRKTLLLIAVLVCVADHDGPQAPPSRQPQCLDKSGLDHGSGFRVLGAS